jgi:hypothetical protein
LNALSNLYRRAASEGYVSPGFNPVAALIDRPTPVRREAAWLEVHDAALLLESARTHRFAPGSLAQAVISFVRACESWQGSAEELLDVLSARKPAIVVGGWPATVRGLSGHITRVEGQLRASGVHLERVRKGSATTSYGCTRTVL